MSCNKCCGLQKYGDANIGSYSSMNRTDFDKMMQEKWCPNCNNMKPVYCGGRGVCVKNAKFLGDVVENYSGGCGGDCGCGQYGGYCKGGSGCRQRYGGCSSCGGYGY